MGIRHFMTGRRDWIAPVCEDAAAFAEDGEVRVNEYGKPVFSSLKDAENYAMSIVHDEYTLAQWEERRPTMYVVEECVYAKVADCAIECDCEDIVNLALWDSETDEEKIGERTLSAARELDYIDGMSSWVVEDGEIAVTDGELTIEGIRDFVDNVFREGTLGCNSIEFDRSEGNTAYFKVK